MLERFDEVYSYYDYRINVDENPRGKGEDLYC